jgi:hypothetical protein
MRIISRCVSVGLTLGILSASWSSTAATAPREKARFGPARVLIAPIAPWKAFGPKPRADSEYRVRPQTKYTPTSTPVRLRPNRRFYIGPHYKSSYGPGYHTNGPGIGIVR